MKRLFSTFCISALVILSIFPQTETPVWIKDYSESRMCSRDIPTDAVLYNDSILYVTGYTERNFSNYDVTTFAFDLSGDTLWKMTFSTNEMDYSFDKPRRICTDIFGNVFILGHRNIDYANQALFLVKYNRRGKLLWSEVTSHAEFDGQITTLVGFDIITDNGGNLYLFCRYADEVTENNALIIKYDESGRKLWIKNYPYYLPISAKIGRDQNIYLTVNTGDDNKYTLNKLDTAGVVIWEKLLNYGDILIKEIIDACIDSNDNLYLLMDIWSGQYLFPEHQDIQLAKITSTGDLAWENQYNGLSGNYDHGIKMNLVKDSIILVGLSTRTVNNDLDAVVLKFNSEGRKIDSLFMGSLSHNNDYLTTMATDDLFNTYITLTSHTNTAEADILAMKIDSGLSVTWKFKLTVPEETRYYAKGSYLTCGSRLVIVGNINSTFNQALSYDTDIDFLISFIDTSGILKKEFKYTESGTSNFRLAKIDLDPENNIYLSGYCQIGPDWDEYVNYFNYNYFILKYSKTGELQWSNSIGNDTLIKWTYLNQFRSDSIITLIGNGYSEKTSKYYTILYSFNLKGELVKSKAINNYGYYCLNSVNDDDGNIYLYVPRYDNTYSSLVKLNADLDIEWDYHLTEISQLEANAVIKVVSDGRIYLAGKDRKVTVINENGKFNKEILLNALFDGINTMEIDSVCNLYLGGYLTGSSNKTSFAKIDSTGYIIWHFTNTTMQWLKKIIKQKKTKDLVAVGTQCSIVGCSPTFVFRFTPDGKISDSLSLAGVYPQEVVTDNNDFLYIANSDNYFVMVSPNLDSLFQSKSINDSIYYTYSLSDIETDSDHNIIITGTFGNEIYLHSNEWKAITTIKFGRLNARPFILDLKTYYRMQPFDTLLINLQIYDFDDESFLISFPGYSDWIEFNHSASQIKLTPDSSDLGTHKIKLTIEDNEGNSGSYAIVVKVGNAAPVFISSPPLTIEAENNYFYKPKAEDRDNDSLIYEIVEGPVWLNIANDGVIYGIPGYNDSTYHVALLVRDQFGGQAVQEFDIKVIIVGIDYPSQTLSNDRYLIYPNPSYEYINIIPLNDLNKGLVICLIDNNGKILAIKDQPFTAKGEKIGIVTNGLKPGIYYLLIKEPVRIYSCKVVIN